MKPELIGEIIYFHRKQAGLSRQQLAHISGLGKTVIYDIEKGKLTVKLSSLLKVMYILNIKLEFKSPLMDLFKGELDEEN